MIPVLFEIPGIDYPVSSFAVLMALGFLAAYALTQKRMEESGLSSEAAWSLLIWIAIGGVVGSKLYFAVDNALRTEIPFRELLFNPAGITWYGGLMGGALAAYLGCRAYRVPFGAFANSAAVGCAVGQALGRLGCFLAGDDYGLQTDVLWGVAFPLGQPPTLVPVHPTQLYEMTWLLLVSHFLWRRRRTSPSLAGEYLVANGIGRIVIEQWRLNPAFGGLTEPQWIGILIVCLGAALWIRAHRVASAERGLARPTPG